MVELDGPRLTPASGGAPRQLVIFCHGFGADGNDLIALGQQWHGLLPDAGFVSPHAPEPCVMSPIGRQWFPITRLDPDEYWTGCQAAAPILDHFIAGELARYDLTDADLALVGFSQGTMLALHVGLRRANPAALILGYSGALAGPEHLDADIKSKPPVLLIHGRDDDIVPVAALPQAAGKLGELGVPVTSHISDNLGHGIDQAGLELGGKALADAFKR